MGATERLDGSWRTPQTRPLLDHAIRDSIARCHKPTATFPVLFVLLILSHDRRRVVHLRTHTRWHGGSSLGRAHGKTSGQQERGGALCALSGEPVVFLLVGCLRQEPVQDQLNAPTAGAGATRPACPPSLPADGASCSQVGASCDYDAGACACLALSSSSEGHWHCQQLEEWDAYTVVDCPVELEVQVDPPPLMVQVVLDTSQSMNESAPSASAGTKWDATVAAVTNLYGALGSEEAWNQEAVLSPFRRSCCARSWRGRAEGARPARPKVSGQHCISSRTSQSATRLQCRATRFQYGRCEHRPAEKTTRGS